MAGCNSEITCWGEGAEPVSHVQDPTVSFGQQLFWLMQSLGCVRPGCQCMVMQPTCVPSQLDVSVHKDRVTNTGGGRQEQYLNYLGTEMMV